MTQPTSSPNIPLPLPKLSKRAVALSGISLLLLAGSIWGIMQLLKQPVTEKSVAPPQPLVVKTLTIQPQAVPQTLELSGTIRPIEQAVLSTKVMGRITYLALEAGDRFRKGQVLARINVIEMTAQTNQARSGVAQAQAELARTQATLSQLESQRLEALSTLRLAEIDQQRMAKLQPAGAVSQERLDRANTSLDEAKARVAQTEAGIRQSQAAIAQSQAAIAQAKAGVTAASANESYGMVTAPFDGVVVEKLAYEGEMAAPGTSLLRLENPNRLQLEISVPEENLRFVRIGQPVPIQVDAVNRQFKGKIGQIVPAANPNSRSFLVKIPLARSDSLISGMFGRIELSTPSLQKTIAIPTTALIRRGQLEGVYAIESGQQPQQSVALLRRVKTGKVQNGRVAITSGLVAGDRIAISHIQQLSDGQQLTVTSDQ